jgi:hypothetical protein
MIKKKPYCPSDNQEWACWNMRQTCPPWQRFSHWSHSTLWSLFQLGLNFCLWVGPNAIWMESYTNRETWDGRNWSDATATQGLSIIKCCFQLQKVGNGIITQSNRVYMGLVKSWFLISRSKTCEGMYTFCATQFVVLCSSFSKKMGIHGRAHVNQEINTTQQ